MSTYITRVKYEKTIKLPDGSTETYAAEAVVPTSNQEQIKEALELVKREIAAVIPGTKHTGKMVHEMV